MVYVRLTMCMLEIYDEYGILSGLLYICYRFVTSMVCMLHVCDEYGVYVTGL